MTNPTPDQLAENVRVGIADDTGIAWPDAYDGLDALLALAKRCEQAEQERDEWKWKHDARGVELDVVLQGREAAEAERDRLAAALEQLDRAARSSHINWGGKNWYYDGKQPLDAALEVSREALAQTQLTEWKTGTLTVIIIDDERPDPDLAGDYAAEWKDGEPPQEEA